MLTMKPVRTIEEIKSLCEEFNSGYDSNILAYGAYDGKNFIGAGFFIIDDGAIDIISIATEDSSDKLLADGLKRAILNYASIEGLETYTIAGGEKQSIADFFKACSGNCKGNE